MRFCSLVSISSRSLTWLPDHRLFGKNGNIIYYFFVSMGLKALDGFPAFGRSAEIRDVRAWQSREDGFADVQNQSACGARRGSRSARRRARVVSEKLRHS